MTWHLLIEQKRLRDPSLFWLVLIALVLNIVLWGLTHRLQPKWPNVPPAPPTSMAAGSGAGDQQFAYRLLAYPLQQMGNEGGMFTPLKDYNYDRLGEWFMALHGLDPQANYVPYLAAYYFGATQNPERQLKPVVDYLAVAGQVQGVTRKWFWLSQAVYLAYYKEKNHARGLELAEILSHLPDQDIPIWGKQLPAILRTKQGDKKVALGMMYSMLQNLVAAQKAGQKVEPTEIRFLIDFICDRLHTPTEAKGDPVCQGRTATTTTAPTSGG